MYQVEAWASVRRATRGTGALAVRRAVSANVLALGFTSLLTDISSEMVNTVLPMYVVLHLGLTPFSYGLLDGIAQGVAAVVHLLTGAAADRFRRNKEIAGLGYAVSAATRLGLLTAGGAWSGLAAMVAADRVGKGIRTVPRDVLISLSTPRGAQATAFGVHRALDSAGAMLGPVAALAVLAAAPSGFDVVFMTSFCVALCGVAVIATFVSNVTLEPASVTRGATPFAGLWRAVRLHGIAPLAGAVVLLGSATVGDGFLYLILQRQTQFTAVLLPLLYMGTAASYLLLAVPIGRLADALGSTRVFVVGYALLGGAYTVTLAAGHGDWRYVSGAVLLLGGYYAATDGVLMAVAGTICPPDLRGSAMAALTTSAAVGRLVAAMSFGALWTVSGATRALSIFLAALGAAATIATILVWSAGARASDRNVP